MELANKDQLIIAPPEAEGQRLDRLASSCVKKLSRSRVQTLIEDGNILVNGAPSRASYKVRPGDRISVSIPAPRPSKVVGENIPLDVVYEDEQVIVVNKPAGMVVHPAAGNYSGTLVHALLYRLPGICQVGGVERPGIVHRLDKDTSGLIIAAKTDQAHASLSTQIKERSVIRTYLAIVKGHPGPDEAVIETNIGRSKKDRKKMTVVTEGGKHAVTTFKLETQLERHSLLRLNLGTGRTHQIRAHMLHINCPVLGDATYGRTSGPKIIGRQALHAWKLGFTNPASGDWMDLTAPMPEDMAQAIRALGGDPAPYL